MNNNNQQQIAGIIQDFRIVPTRTGNPMGAFTIGTIPSKCFGSIVQTIEHFSTTGNPVSVNGHFSAYKGTNEFIVETITIFTPDQAVTNTSVLPASFSVTTNNPASVRASSTVTEDVFGRVIDVEGKTTHSGRQMVAFKIGIRNCKAFNDLANIIQKAEGRQIKISGRKGNFQGSIEYAVETIKTIDGVAVNIRDTRSVPIKQFVNNPNDCNSFNNSNSHQVIVPETANALSETQKPTAINATSSTVVDPRQEGASKTVLEESSPINAGTLSITPVRPAYWESLVQNWVKTLDKPIYSIKTLEKYSKDDDTAGEAARRILAKRREDEASNPECIVF